MPTQRFANNVGAGATVENIMDGSVYEYVRGAGRLSVAAVGSNATECLMTILLDADQVMAEGPVPLEPGAGTGPNINEHTVLIESVRPGDKITIRLRNTGAAARDFRTLVSVP